MQTIKKLLLLVAVLQTLMLTAQSNIGLRAGIHLATITESQEDLGTDLDFKNITGLNVAIYKELDLSKLLTLQPELNYLQKGSLITGKDWEEQSEITFKVVVNYLELPVLGKLRLGSKAVQAFILAGPSVGYALGGKGHFEIEGVTVTEKIEFDKDLDDDGLKDQRWDLSAILGAGGTVAAGPGRVVLDARYGLDFTDFTKFKNAAPSGYEKSYNRGLGISLGYQIPVN